MTCRVARLSTLPRDAAKPVSPVVGANTSAQGPDRSDVLSAGAMAPTLPHRELEPARSA
jgi:hypothetical protein